MIDTDLFREFIRVDREIKDLESRLRDLKSVRDHHATTISDQMIEEGVARLNIDGRTVYLHTQLWANARLDEQGNRNFKAACEALTECGYSDFVETKFSTQRVSSLVRELNEGDTGIPPALAEALEITEKISPRVRG